MNKETRKLLAEMKKREKERLAKRRLNGLCCAILHHGPGHQSQTFCQKKGEHKIHECRYGSYDELARWKGMKKFTGYFDEPPEEQQGD